MMVPFFLVPFEFYLMVKIMKQTPFIVKKSVGLDLRVTTISVEKLRRQVLLLLGIPHYNANDGDKLANIW